MIAFAKNTVCHAKTDINRRGYTLIKKPVRTYRCVVSEVLFFLSIINYLQQISNFFSSVEYHQSPVSSASQLIYKTMIVHQ